MKSGSVAIHPSAAKAAFICGSYGTSKLVPFQNGGFQQFQRVKPSCSLPKVLLWCCWGLWYPPFPQKTWKGWVPGFVVMRTKSRSPAGMTDRKARTKADAAGVCGTHPFHRRRGKDGAPGFMVMRTKNRSPAGMTDRKARTKAEAVRFCGTQVSRSRPGAPRFVVVSTV